MPSITGQLGVTLTVRDVERSAKWYVALLEMRVRYNYRSDDGSTHYVCLDHPEGVLELCLVSHATDTGEPFSEFRTGLDHLEFLVTSSDDLLGWAEKLDHLGISHSGVKAPSYTRNSMITFRDPDDIQLEFFWKAPQETES